MNEPVKNTVVIDIKSFRISNGINIHISKLVVCIGALKDSETLPVYHA